MKKIQSSTFALLIAAGCLSSGAAIADEIEVIITNLTPGQPFSPPVVVVHNVPVTIAGLTATPGLELLAEDGDPSAFMAELSGNPAIGGMVAASGPVPPGTATTLTVEADSDFEFVSVFGMLVNTNDTFFASLSERTSTSEQVVAFADGWDAGTEVNNETCANIPGPFCAGSPGGPDESGVIYISNGVHGAGDLIPAMHDWRNPVAQIAIRRQ